MLIAFFDYFILEFRTFSNKETKNCKNYEQIYIYFVVYFAYLSSFLFKISSKGPIILLKLNLDKDTNWTSVYKGRK